MMKAMINNKWYEPLRCICTSPEHYSSKQDVAYFDWQTADILTRVDKTKGNLVETVYSNKSDKYPEEEAYGGYWYENRRIE